MHRSALIFLTAALSFAQPPLRDIEIAFSGAEAARRQYVSSSRATLTMQSKDRVPETFPYVLRKLLKAENGVCTADATFEDGVLVYGNERTPLINCADLISEFTSVKIEDILRHPDLRPQIGGAATGKWTFAKPARAADDCLGSSQVTLIADSQSFHPTQIFLRAGGGCRPASPQGPFRPGSTQEITFSRVDGVWQVVKVVETYAYNLRDYQEVPRVIFFGRTFTAKNRMLAPTLQQVKEFFDFRRMIESFVPNITPDSLKLNPSVGSSVTFGDQHEPIAPLPPPAPRR